MKTNSPHFQERQQTLSRVNIHEEKKRKKKLLCKPEDFFLCSCTNESCTEKEREKGEREKRRENH